MVYTLPFYRSQNILGWSNFFVPDQKLVYTLHAVQSQTFCARPKDDFRNYCKFVFFVALNAIQFLVWLKKFGTAQNSLGPVERQGIGLAQKVWDQHKTF